MEKLRMQLHNCECIRGEVQGAGLRAADAPEPTPRPYMAERSTGVLRLKRAD